MSNYKNKDLAMYAEAFKALANPHRLQIFSLLSNCCEPGTSCATDTALSCCVGDLVPQLEIAPSTLSHHLKELHRAGLIDMRRQGKQIFCSVNPAMLTELRTLFNLYERNRPHAVANEP